VPKKRIDSGEIVGKIEQLVKSRMLDNKVVSLEDLNRLRRQKVAEISILVVDDDVSIRASLLRLLTEEGYRVLMAADGLELSKVLETDTPDLIVLDVGLPWINGLELTTLMKSHEQLSDRFDFSKKAAGDG
jgi:PleD family two-component response regulator